MNQPYARVNQPYDHAFIEWKKKKKKKKGVARVDAQSTRAIIARLSHAQY